MHQKLKLLNIQQQTKPNEVSPFNDKKFQKAAKVIILPPNSFTQQQISANTTIEIDIKLRSFWVSNEITNKEFRIFLLISIQMEINR